MAIFGGSDDGQSNETSQSDSSGFLDDVTETASEAASGAVETAKETTSEATETVQKTAESAQETGKESVEEDTTATTTSTGGSKTATKGDDTSSGTDTSDNDSGGGGFVGGVVDTVKETAEETTETAKETVETGVETAQEVGETAQETGEQAQETGEEFVQETGPTQSKTEQTQPAQQPETPEPEQGIESTADFAGEQFTGKIDSVREQATRFEGRIVGDNPNLDREDVRITRQDGQLQAELTSTGQQALTAEELGLTEQDIAITESGQVQPTSETAEAEFSIRGIEQQLEEQFPDAQSFSIDREAGGFDVEVTTGEGETQSIRYGEPTEESVARQFGLGEEDIALQDGEVEPTSETAEQEFTIRGIEEEIKQEYSDAQSFSIDREGERYDVEVTTGEGETVNITYGEPRKQAVKPTPRPAVSGGGLEDIGSDIAGTFGPAVGAIGTAGETAAGVGRTLNVIRQDTGEAPDSDISAGELTFPYQERGVEQTEAQPPEGPRGPRASMRAARDTEAAVDLSGLFDGGGSDYSIENLENVGPQSGVATDPETIREAEIDEDVLEAYRGETVEGIDSPKNVSAGLLSAEQEENLQGLAQGYQETVRNVTGFEDSTGAGRAVRGFATGIGQVGNLPQWALTTETVAETAQKTPEVAAEEGVATTLETFTAGGREAAGTVGESVSEDPVGSVSTFAGQLATGIGAGVAGRRALVSARSRLRTGGMDFQGDIPMTQLERPDVTSGQSRLTRFSEEAVSGGKRSMDPEDFPVETAETPSQELRNLAEEFSDPELEDALNVGEDEFTLFSARSGLKSEEFVPRSGRPYDPDAAFFAGSVSSNFLDVPAKSGALSGNVPSLRLPRPVKGTRSLIRAARGEDTPTIVATAGRIEGMPEGVAGKATETAFLRQRSGTGTFFTRRPEAQSGEAEALISARAADKDVDFRTTTKEEATKFVRVGDPFRTQYQGEDVPIQLFRPATQSDIDAGDVDTLSRGEVSNLARSESIPGGESGTPVYPTPPTAVSGPASGTGTLAGGDDSSFETRQSPTESRVADSEPRISPTYEPILGSSSPTAFDRPIAASQPTDPVSGVSETSPSVSQPTETAVSKLVSEPSTTPPVSSFLGDPTSGVSSGPTDLPTSLGPTGTSSVPPTRDSSVPPTRDSSLPPTRDSSVPPTEDSSVPPTRTPEIPPTKIPKRPPNRPIDLPDSDADEDDFGDLFDEVRGERLTDFIDPLSGEVLRD